MDLVSLRYFVETAKQRSISRAAVSLGVVQPALSRRIQLLEAHLGVPLLMRHRRGVEPTEAGTLLIERATLILRMTEQLEAEIHSQVAEPVGEVGFAFPPSIGILLVGKLLSTYVARYPRVRLHLQEDYSPGVRDALLAGSIDVGIMSCEAQHPDLVLEPMFTESMWLVGRNQDWPFDSDRLNPRCLDDLPIIVGVFMRRLLERQQAKWNYRIRAVVEADSLTLAKEMLRAGGAFLVVPSSSLDRELTLGEFVGAPLGGLNVTRGLFRHRDRPATRASLALTDMIGADVAHLLRTRPEMFRPVGDDLIHSDLIQAPQ